MSSKKRTAQCSSFRRSTVLYSQPRTEMEMPNNSCSFLVPQDPSFLLLSQCRFSSIFLKKKNMSFLLAVTAVVARVAQHKKFCVLDGILFQTTGKHFDCH